MGVAMGVDFNRIMKKIRERENQPGISDRISFVTLRSIEPTVLQSGRFLMTKESHFRLIITHMCSAAGFQGPED